MPSSYTSNYNLSQWERTDKVLMGDFNADNEKIDGAIKAVDRRVDSLAGTVSGKAEQSALSAEISARTSAVSALNAALARRGNCDIRVSTYTGDGTNTKTLTFPFSPALVIIIGSQSLALFSEIISAAIVVDSGRGTTIHSPQPKWNGPQLSFSDNDSRTALNLLDYQYQVISFYKVS